MFVTLPGFKISPKCVCGRGRAPWTLLEELTALSRPLARLGEGRKGKEGKGRERRGRERRGRENRGGRGLKMRWERREGKEGKEKKNPQTKSLATALVIDAYA